MDGSARADRSVRSDRAVRPDRFTRPDRADSNDRRPRPRPASASDRPVRTDRAVRTDRPLATDRPLPKRWGSVARRGARVVGEEPGYTPEKRPQSRRPPVPDEPDIYEERVSTPKTPRAASGNPRSKSAGRVAGEGRPIWKTEARVLPDDVVEELSQFATTKSTKQGKQAQKASTQRGPGGTSRCRC